MVKKLSLLFVLCLIGCASIIKDSTQDVIINTYPSGANVEVKNSNGRVIHNFRSPGVVTLKRSDGSYFGEEKYQITLKKVGYMPKKVFIESEINDWYLFGNLFFGGLIGWILVDPTTGRMYDLKPEEINEVLIKGE